MDCLWIIRSFDGIGSREVNRNQLNVHFLIARKTTMIIIKLYNGKRIESMYYVEDNEGFHISSGHPDSFSNVIKFYPHSDIEEVTDLQNQDLGVNEFLKILSK